MNVFYSRTSLKHLSKLEKKIRTHIVSAINKLPETGDIKKLRGASIEDLYRLRVGRIRVFYIWRTPDIRILDVDTRGDIYSRSR